MKVNWLEWIGYLASVIVLVSLLMSSIIKLRWINLLGSGIFALYGFFVGTLPVGFLNICICIINIYYLLKIYRSRESFNLLPIDDSAPYYKYFMDYYRKGIEKYMSFDYSDPSKYVIRFFILRNVVPAGIFLASRFDDETLLIDLDFVTPEYRDFKIGKYVFENKKKYFLDKGYSRFICTATNYEYVKYLKKMGFVQTPVNGKEYFVKSLM